MITNSKIQKRVYAEIPVEKRKRKLIIKRGLKKIIIIMFGLPWWRGC